MKNTLSLLSLLISFAFANPASSQFYFNDLQAAHERSVLMKNFATTGVTNVSAAGFDPQGAKTPDFNELQWVNKAAGSLRIATREGQQVTRQTYRFDADYRLTGIIDSSGSTHSITVYTYDNAGHIIDIKLNSVDSLNDFTQTEDHQWQYNSAGQPVKMLKIVNGNDSAEYRFTIDEKGNVADEQLYRRNIGLDPVYYYYDGNNRLTDIVRYDKKLKKLLPDYMFEYDTAGNMTQKTTILSTISRSYLIWRYTYDAKGLKTRESLYNKKKELTGRIEYTYSL